MAFGNLKTWNKDGKVMGSVWVLHSSITPPRDTFRIQRLIFFFGSQLALNRLVRLLSPSHE